MKELDFQRQLLVACIKAGGDGFKTNNRFLKGVADLYLMLAPLPHLWLELKYEPRMPRNGVVKIDTTPHQKNFIKRVNMQGGHATAAVVVNCGGGEYQIGVIPCSSYDLYYRFPGIIKPSGMEWPIRDIMERALC